jgi:hypothetical protein
MTIHAERIKDLIRIVLSFIICFGLLKFEAYLRGQKIYVWDVNDWTKQNLETFFNEMLIKTSIYSILSFVFFKYILRIILLSFSNKIKKYLLKLFEDRYIFKKIIKGVIIGINIRNKIKPFVYKEKSEDEANYLLALRMNDIALWINIFICFLIINNEIIYKFIFIPIILFLLMLMIFINPFVEALNKEIKIRYQSRIRK